MDKKFLSMTIIFEGSNLNYGETFGTVGSIKKFGQKGRNYSYLSRQAIGYDLRRMLNEDCGFAYGETQMKGSTAQFSPDASIKESVEIDLFGYMKTNAKESAGIRKGCVRLSNAVSLEPFHNDIQFANNMGLSQRTKDGHPLPYQFETHKSYYSYTVTIDLAKVGEDGKESIPNDEKANRVKQLLECIKLLNRDIRGKRENLTPRFIIGGNYNIGSPFFYNIPSVSFEKSGKARLNTAKINDVLSLTAFGESVKEQTMLGALADEFSNLDEIDTDKKMNIEGFFAALKEQVSGYYGV